MTADELIEIVRKHDDCNETVCVARNLPECDLADVVRVLTRRITELEAESTQLAERDLSFGDRLETAINRLETMLMRMER